MGIGTTLGALRVLSTEKFVETSDAIFFEATAETQGYGVLRVYDAFALKDGKDPPLHGREVITSSIGMEGHT